MKNLIEVIKMENRRGNAANTERLLLDLYEIALASDGWEDLDQVTRANIFNEVRSLIALKKNLESVAPDPVAVMGN